METLILGTRGSDLALAQTDLVVNALRQANPKLVIEKKIIKTLGDKRQDLSLDAFCKEAQKSGETRIDKGIFIKELEKSLLAEEIHAAVHSLKDVPTEMEREFSLSAVLARASLQDVLITKRQTSLKTINEKAVIATSSPRRKALLHWLRSDLVVEDIRGNVPTRLRKLQENPALDGILLARAGLERLGYDLSQGILNVHDSRLYVDILDPEEFFPCAGQGMIAIEILRDNEQAVEITQAINHVLTYQQMLAERHFLHLLRAGCTTPVGVYSQIEQEELLHMKAFVADEGSAHPPQFARASGRLEEPLEVAQQLFRSLA